jgi:hypothetical protein
VISFWLLLTPRICYVEMSSTSFIIIFHSDLPYYGDVSQWQHLGAIKVKRFIASFVG